MLNEDIGKLVIVTRRILLRIRNISDKVLEKIKAHISYSVNFSFEDRAIDTVMRKNTAEPDTRQMTILRIRILRLVPKATDTHSE